MKNEKEIKKEDVKVLDKGVGVDIPVSPLFFCCMGIYIPFRMG